MSNKRISELPYIDQTKISGNTLVPLVTYYSAVTGTTVHTYVDDFKDYILSGVSGLTEIYVTGGTYSANTITFTNNTGGTFTVTGITVTGTTIVVGDYLPLSGGTVTGSTSFTSGLNSNIISATTYQNLPISGLTAGNNINISGSNGNFTISVTGITSGTTFTGNTSATCINDLYVSNLHGCSPITIHDSIQFTGSTASGLLSYAQGENTTALGNYSHAEGIETKASGNFSHAEGGYTTASGLYSHAEGQGATALGVGSSASGYYSETYGDYSHAEGGGTKASGLYSHAEGYGTTALGEGSHAEGYVTTASGNYSHAEGYLTTASGYYSHAEGFKTIAEGKNSHAEGGDQANDFAGGYAIGVGSHAEGQSTTALGYGSHAEGYGTITNGNYQHVQGLWNLTASTQGAFIVGNGINDNNRSNLIFAAGNQVNISGKTTTTNLQVTSGATPGYVLTAIDTSGNTSWKISEVVGNYLPLSGGTVTGDTIFTNGLTATTISATTYQNLPTDIRVTGATYSDNTFTYTNNTGGTFNTSFNTVTGLTINGNLTVTGNTSLQGLTATTISATTYQNLPTDIRVTGGTYSTGTATFTNNTGGTFNVTGFYTGETSVVNSITTGTGLSGDSTTGNVTLINTQPDQEVTISGGTGILTGGTYPNFTLTNSAPDQTVVLNNGSNISVTGTYPNFTIDVTGLTDLNTYVTGFTYQDNTFTISDNSGSTFNATIDTVTGLTINGDLTITGTITSETISATTYQNLPTDIRVTGATYSDNTFTYTNNTGGTFNTSFNTVTGLTINGNLTVTGNTSLQNLTATTISATTYQNLPVSGLTAGSNIIITGGSGNFTITASITTGPFGISNSGGIYTYYSTLSSAMSAATSGQVIEMFADVTDSTGTSVTLKPNVIIQGNGHTYTHTNTTGNTFTVTTTGTYRFMNMVIKRTVTTPTGAYIFTNNPGGNFYQGYTMIFQNTSIEYTWTSSTGATPFIAPSTNVCFYYIDGIRALSNGSGVMFSGNNAYVQNIKNSIIENTGTGSCFSSDNITGGSYIENCHLKTNSGTVVSFNFTAQGDGIRNSTVNSTSGIGVSGGYVYDTSSFSNTNRAFSGVICYRCIGSTGSGTVYYQSTAWNSNGVSSTGYVLQPFFTLSSFYNCSLYSAGNIVVYDTTYSAALYNCSIVSAYNNVAGHAISLANVGNVLVNCYVSVTNASANCFRGTSAISAKYSNNTFAGATTPVNANVTQSIVNTQDNQGNILI